MHRIDSAGNRNTLPGPLAGVNAPGYFENAVGPGAGTVLDPDWANSIQEEIANVVEGASLVLNKANNAQLLAAIQALVAGVMPTGFRGATSDTIAPAGWVLASGRTIGNAASNATERANADTQALFTAYWTRRADLQLYNAGGGAIARGVSAAIDWGNNCAIAVPDYNGRIGIGKDTMAGAPAGRVTIAGGGVDGTTIGATGGGQNVVIIKDNLPSVGRYDWSHGADTPSTGGGNVHGADRQGDVIGLDTPLHILPPVMVELKIIKL